MNRRPNVFCLRTLLIASLLLWLCAGKSSAQLTVLSSQDPDAQWFSAQIETLEEQLSGDAIRGPLRKELQSQLRWLEAWGGNELKAKPLWEVTSRTPLQEPSIDPNGLVKDLRSRLLGPGSRPTVRDTKELEAMLVKHPDDLGVRQLHLHWLDQRQYRKQYAPEIADSALKVFTLLQQLEPRNPQQEEQIGIATMFSLYRRGRALAYRELPEVAAARPIEDEQQHESDLVGAYSQLVDRAGDQRVEFILLDIRMLRRDHFYGTALATLEGYGHAINRQWFLKKRRDLLRELGWKIPAKSAAESYAAEFPEEVTKEAKGS